MTQQTDTPRLRLESGVELPPLSLPPVSRTTLALFAGASGDHNPIHVDIDAAREAGFPDVFGHGMLSMAYVGRLVTRWVPQSRVRSISCRFTSMMPVLGRPTCFGTVTEVVDRDGERQARIELALRLDDGTSVITGEAVVAAE